MNKQTYVKALRLVLLLTAMIWGVAQASAQGNANAHKAAGGQTTITDAAGRVHKRTARITDTQRKAVAKRQTQALHLKAEQKKAGVKK